MPFFRRRQNMKEGEYPRSCEGHQPCICGAVPLCRPDHFAVTAQYLSICHCGANVVKFVLRLFDVGKSVSFS